MMDDYSIEKQLDICIDIRRTLEEICADLDQTLKYYDEAMTFLKVEKMFADIVRKFLGIESRFKEESEELIKHIEHDHLEYIEKQCKELANTFLE
jgi:hypothetical protein